MSQDEKRESKEGQEPSAAPQPAKPAMTAPASPAYHIPKLPQDEDEPGARVNRNLRRALVACVLVLVLVLAGIGLLMWKNSAAPNVAESQTQSLSTGQAGSGTAVFTALGANDLPHVAKYYGTPLKSLKKAAASRLVFDKKLAKAKPQGTKGAGKIKYAATAKVMSAAGGQLGRATFYLDSKKRICRVALVLDMDDLGVAPASFQELSSSDVVASSLLRALGLSEKAVSAAKLTVDLTPGSYASSDEAESCSFSGKTGAKLKKSKKTKKNTQVDFMEWRLTESYDYSQKDSGGDGSVLRQVTVELF